MYKVVVDYTPSDADNEVVREGISLYVRIMGRKKSPKTRIRHKIARGSRTRSH